MIKILINVFQSVKMIINMLMTVIIDVFHIRNVKIIQQVIINQKVNQCYVNKDVVINK